MQEVFPILKAMTGDAKVAIGGAEQLSLDHFPYRVGRESRFKMFRGERVSLERRMTAAQPNNDVYLVDQNEILNVSREHFQINRLADGTYSIQDRGSTCGTQVDGKSLGGGSSEMESPLAHGSVITVGTTESAFQFTFLCKPE